MVRTIGVSDMAVEGTVHGMRGARPGYAVIRGGVLREAGYGECPVEPDRRGTILTDVVNAHTHCADYGLRVPPGLSLEELVAPPDGLKHRYLREASDEELSESMRRFARDSAAAGSAAFVDFREGGEAGCRLLRAAAPEAVILGRPVSPVFDPEEVDRILSVADGIGVSSISDMDRGYIEALADEVRERRMVLGIHVSERVREDIDFVLSLDPAFVVHMCEATDSDLLKCAEAEVPVVVCPTSNLYFGKVPPIARAQAMGVDLAIGTDNGMLRGPDLVDEAGLFARIAEAQGGDPDGAWPAMSRLAGNILYRDVPITVHSGFGSTTVLLSDGKGALEALAPDAPAVRPETKRGCEDEFSEYPCAHRR